MPAGQLWGAAEALTSMTLTSAWLKSMFSSLGRGTPAPSTPVGHKPAQPHGPGAWPPTPSSLSANPSLHGCKVFQKGFAQRDAACRQSASPLAPASEAAGGGQPPGGAVGPLFGAVGVRLPAKRCHPQGTSPLAGQLGPPAPVPRGKVDHTCTD